MLWRKNISTKREVLYLISVFIFLKKIDTLREEIFAGINFREFFLGHFAGINFREFGFTEDFLGINIRESGLAKDFAGINFRERDLYKDFAGIDFAFALSDIFPWL